LSILHLTVIIISLDLKIDNNLIERVTSTKFLGVILNENLSWNSHILLLVNKLNKSIGILRALQHKLPINILYSLYNTLVYPYLQYSNIAWAAQPNKYIDQLFILQKELFVAILCKTAWYSHTTPLFNKVQTLKLSDINKLQTGCFMYRFFTNNLPTLFQKSTSH
jgi:hypothetical protein